MTQRAVRVQQAGTSKDHWAPRHTFPRSMAARAYGFPKLTVRVPSVPSHARSRRTATKHRNEAPQHHNGDAPSSRVGFGD